MSREPPRPGSELLISQDFYTLSTFRDLTLHECEHQMTVAGIEAFLEAAGLTFRGFTLPPQIFEQFQARYPDDPWPGLLGNWADMEAAQTSLFDGMYTFWCEKHD